MYPNAHRNAPERTLVPTYELHTPPWHALVPNSRHMQPLTVVSNNLLPALVEATMELYRQVRGGEGLMGLCLCCSTIMPNAAGPAPPVTFLALLVYLHEQGAQVGPASSPIQHSPHCPHAPYPCTHHQCHCAAPSSARRPAPDPTPHALLPTLPLPVPRSPASCSPCPRGLTTSSPSATWALCLRLVGRGTLCSVRAPGGRGTSGPAHASWWAGALYAQYALCPVCAPSGTLWV